jgi:hypothetical protein
VRSDLPDHLVIAQQHYVLVHHLRLTHNEIRVLLEYALTRPESLVGLVGLH